VHQCILVTPYGQRVAGEGAGMKRHLVPTSWT
jgi:hypothetical protein